MSQGTQSQGTQLKGPKRGPWQALRCLQKYENVAVWVAKNASGQSGLLKIAENAKGQTALAREVILLKKVDHPRVPALIACGDERKWLVREFVDGLELNVDSPLPLGEAVEITAGLAEILAHLHGKGLVHADLKPSNVIVDTQGKVHLLDFGIACVELSRARPGHFKGTLGYAAPEQLQGLPLQSGTDIYSLGTILYQLIAGRLPFQAEDPSALAYLPLATLPEPVSNLRLGLPEELVDLIMRMLARDVSRRPSSGPDLGPMLRESAASPALPAIVGMSTTRASLRSLVSVAVRGQGGVVVVYGAKGSGRKTVIAEAIRGARREGLPTSDSIQETLEALNVTMLEEVVVYFGEASDPDAVALASRILSDRLPCLLLLRSEQPLVVLERRGARHVVPEPLSESEVSVMLKAVGRSGAQSGELWRRTKGHPGRIQAALDLQAQGAAQLSAMETALLAQCRDNARPLSELAMELKLGAHAAVDIAERLVDLGLLTVGPNGRTVLAKGG